MLKLPGHSKGILSLLAFSAWVNISIADSYQIVAIPDTQAYSGFPENQEIFKQQTAWIAANIEAERIVFVTHLGDVVGRMPKTVPVGSQWPVADAAFAAIDGKVPYSVVYGNHDHDQFPPRGNATTNIAQQWFGRDRYNTYDWFGGASPNGANFYQLFNLGEHEVLHIALRFTPEDAEIEWARGVLAQNAGIPAIVSTHSYLQDAGFERRGGGEVLAGRTSAGEYIWQNLVRDHDQVFMTFAGHNHAGTNIENSGEYNDDGEYHQVSSNAAGRDVYEFLADYQDYPNGGDGWLQLFEFDLDERRLNVRTYSPYLGAFQDDRYSQFSIDIDFEQRLKPLQSIRAEDG